MSGEKITGFVLAGGQSRRMGQDKAQIPWDHVTLLSHAYKRLKQVASTVFVVGNPGKANAEVAVLPDIFPSQGPLAGLHSALHHTRTDWNLILAVDLPLVPVALLRFLVGFREAIPVIAVAPRVGGRIQPLCAAYHRSLIRDIDQRLQEGNVSIHHLLENVNSRIIEEQELLAAGFSGEMLLNVNTPEDLEQARNLAKTLHV